MEYKKYEYEKTFFYNILRHADWFYTCVSGGSA